MVSKKHYCISNAALAFDGLPRLLVSPSATVLVSGDSLQYFKRIAIPTMCLQMKFLRKPGQILNIKKILCSTSIFQTKRSMFTILIYLLNEILLFFFEWHLRKIESK